MVRTLCPGCQQLSLFKRFTLRGLLYAIFCFPCGLFCCFRRRQQFCDRCQCEILSGESNYISPALGYRYRDYESTYTTGISPNKSAAYRNEALSVSISQQESGYHPSITNSTAELIHEAQ